jgi:hypothetical protein
VIGLSLVLVTIKVTPDGFIGAKEPQIAIEGRSVYIAYSMGDTCYLSISKDGGNTYGRPVVVANAGRLSLGMRRGPRIAVHRGAITISAVYGNQGKGADGDLLSWTSTDEGQHWSSPLRVNDVPGSAREGLHAMAVGPDGTLACVWLDLRTKGTKLYLSTKLLKQSQWSPNRLIAQSPDGSICQCCHPSVTFDPKGGLHVMFRNSLDGNRDMYSLSAPSATASFSPPVQLGVDHWPLNACPMDGGALAVDRMGQIQTVWRRADQVFASATTGSEKPFASGKQPWMAIGSQGRYDVWIDGNAVLARRPDGGPARLADEGNDPVVVVDGRLAVAAWSHDGIEAALL